MSDLRPIVKTRYRHGRVLWIGEVFRCAEFVDAFIDGVKPIRVWQGFALTEKRLRRKLARAAWREKHPPVWNVGGRRASA